MIRKSDDKRKQFFKQQQKQIKATTKSNNKFVDKDIRQQAEIKQQLQQEQNQRSKSSWKVYKTASLLKYELIIVVIV